MTEKKSMSTARVVMIVLGVVMLAGLATCGTCAVCVGGAATQVAIEEQKEAQRVAKALKRCGDVRTIPWAELAAALKENEAKVTAAWKGNCVKVSGVVDSIDSDFKDRPVVRIGTGERVSHKHCNCKPKDPAAALELVKGQDITVWGLGGNEFVGSLNLEHCEWW